MSSVDAIDGAQRAAPGQSPSRTDQSDGRGANGRGTFTLSEILIFLGILGAFGIVGYLLFEQISLEEEGYDGRAVAYRIATVLVMALFIPFTALSYYRTRRGIRDQELKEDFRMMGLDHGHYDAIFSRETRATHFIYAVSFASIVTLLGLMAVVLGAELNLSTGHNLLLSGGGSANGSGTAGGTQLNALMFFGVAFLGAYLWGLQQIVSRYFKNDLVPGVYYSLGVRMIFAATIALLIFQMLPEFGPGDQSLATGMLPALAFLIGIFPQRALNYMKEKTSMFASSAEVQADAMPLEVIQGISVNNKLRLAEEGIESCYDLAHAELIRLLYTTPFTVSELVDWILQAKLCLFFGNDIKELRRLGIRSAYELNQLGNGGDLDLKSLSGDSRVTEKSLTIARNSLANDKSFELLIELYRRINSVGNLVLSPESEADADIDPADGAGTVEGKTNGAAKGDGPESPPPGPTPAGVQPPGTQS